MRSFAIVLSVILGLWSTPASAQSTATGALIYHGNGDLEVLLDVGSTPLGAHSSRIAYAFTANVEVISYSAGSSTHFEEVTDCNVDNALYQSICGALNDYDDLQDPQPTGLVSLHSLEVRRLANCTGDAAFSMQPRDVLDWDANPFDQLVNSQTLVVPCSQIPGAAGGGGCGGGAGMAMLVGAIPLRAWLKRRK